MTKSALPKPIIIDLPYQSIDNKAEVEKAFVITPEGKSYFYFGLSKTTDERIAQQLQQAFDALKQNGEFDKILQQYLQ